MSAADRLNKIDEQIHDLRAKNNGILSLADEKQGGVLTPEQREEFDANMAKIKTLNSDKDGILKDEARRKELGDIKPPEQLGTQITVPDSIDGRMRIVEKEQKFGSLGEQLQAIATTQTTGRDHPLLKWNNFETLAPATGGAVAGVPSDGGYLIQKDFATELMSRMSAAGTLSDPGLPQPRRIPIGPNADGLELTLINETSRATGSRYGGVQVYWGAEADSATAKKPSFRKSTLQLKELIGLAYVTNRLLNDATALEAVFLDAFSKEMAFMKEDARVNGTGAGQPVGIVGHASTVSVAKESGQAAATLVYENIIKMWSRLWAGSRRNAIWLINQDCEPQLHQMFIQTGTGGYPAYMPPGGISGAPYGTLMGRPVVAVEYCQTLGTAGDIILWDPTQYVEIEKGGMQADQSIHVRFITFENTFRFMTRCDGQPMWNSALTPFKGSNTLSPQVTLATRS